MQPEPAKILIVDDNLQVARILQKSLIREGYDVEMATNGSRGVQKAEDFHPDLIIMDLMMPVMTGLEAAEHLRSHHNTKDIDIIFLTATQQKSERAFAERIGIEKYLSKPFSVREVVTAVKDTLDGKKRVRPPEIDSSESL